MALVMPEFMYPVGEHQQILALNAVQPLQAPQDATHLCIQVYGQIAVRITMDGATPATAALGFRLVANDEPMVFPVTSPSATAPTVSICPEAAGATVDYQWFRRWRAGGG